MITGPAEHRQQALDWIERAAEGGYVEAQYRLVTYFERQAGIMRNLPAMSALALDYQKGRYGLARDGSPAGKEQTRAAVPLQRPLSELT
jgi:TPR repeat protein